MRSSAAFVLVAAASAAAQVTIDLPNPTSIFNEVTSDIGSATSSIGSRVSSDLASLTKSLSSVFSSGVAQITSDTSLLGVPLPSGCPANVDAITSYVSCFVAQATSLRGSSSTISIDVAATSGAALSTFCSAEFDIINTCFATYCPTYATAVQSSLSTRCSGVSGLTAVSIASSTVTTTDSNGNSVTTTQASVKSTGAAASMGVAGAVMGGFAVAVGGLAVVL